MLCSAFLRVYLVVEYVDGVTVENYCRDNRLGIADRVRLLTKVCEAVHYAHRHLVIHCDLKPGNILVNSQGIPKLLDFGTAIDRKSTRLNSSHLVISYAV